MEDVKKEKVCRRLKTIDALSTEDRYPCWNGVSVVCIVFDSLHIFISELLDYLLPIKNGYIMDGGGGGTIPMG